MATKVKKKVEEKLLKLDFGSGPHTKEGFLGVDTITFPGVGFIHDLTKLPWPWKDNSVEEANASHIVEHFTAKERIGFANELYRVLIPGGTCLITTPHWASCRAYGDPTHQWPPVSEFWFYYLDEKWRMDNAPHTDARYIKGGFSCNFESTWGYNLRGDLGIRNQEYQQFAISNYKEVCADTIATIKSKKV
jgi:hypothetical protein